MSRVKRNVASDKSFDSYHELNPYLVSLSDDYYWYTAAYGEFHAKSLVMTHVMSCCGYDEQAYEDVENATIKELSMEDLDSASYYDGGVLS